MRICITKIFNLRQLFSAQVSSMFWLLHSDLHDMKAAAAFEYMSSMVANIKPLTTSTNVLRENNDNFFLLEQNYKRGQFCASLKRRNGRVRVMVNPSFSLKLSLCSYTSTCTLLLSVKCYQCFVNTVACNKPLSLLLIYLIYFIL